MQRLRGKRKHGKFRESSPIDQWGCSSEFKWKSES